MARKIIMPEENVEYTFRFPPKKQLVYRWFGDVNEKGRLLLWNLTGKYYTGMTATYFTYLLKNRLVNKKTVADVSDRPTTKKELVAKIETKIESQKPNYTELTEQEKADNICFCNKCIEEIQGYSDTEKSFLKIKVVQKVSKENVGLYEVGRVISDLERLKGEISDEEYSAIISRYFAISETISSYRARCGGLKL